MGGVKKFFYYIIFFSVLFGSWRFYFQYKTALDKKMISDAIKNHQFIVVLDKYKKLKLKSGKVSEASLQKYFYKAYALYYSGKTQESKEYWEFLLKHSNNNLHISNSLFILAEINFNEKKYDKAKEYFSKKELALKESNLYPETYLYLAKIAFKNKDFDKSLSILHDLLKDECPENISKKIKDFIGVVSLKRIFTRKITSNSVNYIIKPSDTLGAIADKFKTTVELIKKTNNYSSSVIHPNNHLKVITSIFSIVVSKSNNTLTVFENGEFFKEYSVGTGRDNVTPVGSFKITRKQVNPTWYQNGNVIPYGSPENCLGTRWMSINSPGYGIHGTNDDKSIGSQSSAGCIRMRNKDVEEVFSFITINTKVDIVE